MLEKVERLLVGTSPLMTKNGKGADPTWGPTRELKNLTSKRQKTEDDLLMIRQVEWFAGLYLDRERRVCIPSENVLGLVVEGARKSKLGKKAAAGVHEVMDFYPLHYDGPANIEELYQIEKFVDYRAVGMQGKRVMRARPRFDVWSLPITLLVNTDVMNVSEVDRSLIAAGELVGLGEWRPRFGRFTVEA